MSHREPSIRIVTPGGITRFDAFLELWNKVNSLPIKKMEVKHSKRLTIAGLCI
jgi:hypothetical protein